MAPRLQAQRKVGEFRLEVPEIHSWCSINAVRWQLVMTRCAHTSAFQCEGRDVLVSGHLAGLRFSPANLSPPFQVIFASICFYRYDFTSQGKQISYPCPTVTTDRTTSGHLFINVHSENNTSDDIISSKTWDIHRITGGKGKIKKEECAIRRNKKLWC